MNFVYDVLSQCKIVKILDYIGIYHNEENLTSILHMQILEKKVSYEIEILKQLKNRSKNREAAYTAYYIQTLSMFVRWFDLRKFIAICNSIKDIEPLGYDTLKGKIYQTSKTMFWLLLRINTFLKCFFDLFHRRRLISMFKMDWKWVEKV